MIPPRRPNLTFLGMFSWIQMLQRYLSTSVRAGLKYRCRQHAKELQNNQFLKHFAPQKFLYSMQTQKEVFGIFEKRQNIVHYFLNCLDHLICEPRICFEARLVYLQYLHKYCRPSVRKMPKTTYFCKDTLKIRYMTIRNLLKLGIIFIRHKR